jgi:hypothetical protein
MTIKDLWSCRALDVRSSSTAEGAALQMHSPNNTQAQRFRIVPTGTGWYLLQSELGNYLAAESLANKAACLMTNNKSKALRIRLDTRPGIPQLSPEQVLASARKYVGRTDMNCEQLVAQAFYDVGLKYDWRSAGTLISLSERRVGDATQCVGSTGVIHVEIYAGDNHSVHGGYIVNGSGYNVVEASSSRNIDYVWRLTA